MRKTLKSILCMLLVFTMIVSLANDTGITFASLKYAEEKQEPVIEAVPDMPETEVDAETVKSLQSVAEPIEAVDGFEVFTSLDGSGFLYAGTDTTSYDDAKASVGTALDGAFFEAGEKVFFTLFPDYDADGSFTAVDTDEDGDIDTLDLAGMIDIYDADGFVVDVKEELEEEEASGTEGYIFSFVMPKSEAYISVNLGESALMLAAASAKRQAYSNAMKSKFTGTISSYNELTEIPWEYSFVVGKPTAISKEANGLTSWQGSKSWLTNDPTVEYGVYEGGSSSNYGHYVLYKNVGTYKGEAVDARLYLNSAEMNPNTGFAAGEAPGVAGSMPYIYMYFSELYGTTPTQDTTYPTTWVNYTLEFYNQAGQKISPKGMLTFYDIDGVEASKNYSSMHGIAGLCEPEVYALISGADQVYVQGNDLGGSYLRKTTANGATLYGNPRGDGTSANDGATIDEDKRAMLTVLFNGSLTYEYLTVLSHGAGINGMKVIPTTPPAPVKSVGDSDESTNIKSGSKLGTVVNADGNSTNYDDGPSTVRQSNTLSNREQEFTYEIAQVVPYEDVANTKYGSFEIKDHIDEGLEIKNWSLVQYDSIANTQKTILSKTGYGSGKDSSESWDYDCDEESNTISVKATSSYETDSFYNKRYTLVVNVKIKTDTNLGSYRTSTSEDGKVYYVINNQGSSSIELSNGKKHNNSTNSVATFVPKANDTTSVSKKVKDSDGTPYDTKQAYWSSSDSAYVGQFTGDIKVSGNAGVTSAVWEDTLNSNLTYVSNSLSIKNGSTDVTGWGTVSTSGQTVKWTVKSDYLDDIAGKTLTYTFKVKVKDSAINTTSSTTIPNTAKLTVNGSAKTSSTVNLKTPVKPTKEYDSGSATTTNGGNVNRGDSIVYKINYQNPDTVAKTIIVTDVMDTNLSFVSAANASNGTTTLSKPSVGGNGTVKWTIADVPASSSGYVTFTAKVKDTTANNTTIKNKASVQFGNDPALDTNELSNKVVVGDAGIDITKAVNKTVLYANGTATYTLTVTQPTANAIAKNVVVTDTMDSGKGETIDATTIKWRYTPSGGSAGNWVTTGVSPTTGSVNTFTITTGKDMNNGDKIEVTYTGKAGSSISSKQTVKNTATVTAKSENGTDLSDADSKTVTLYPDATIDIAKTVNKTTLYANDTATYTLTVTQPTANAVAKGVEIKDVMDSGKGETVTASTIKWRYTPSGGSAGSWVTTGVSPTSGSVNSFTITTGKDMNNGDKIEVQYTGKVGTSVSSKQTVNNTATVTAKTERGTDLSDSEKKTVTLYPDATIDIAKTVNKTTLYANDTATYTLTVTQPTANAVAKGVEIKDVMDSGKGETVTASTIKWRYIPSGGSAGNWVTTGVSPTTGSVNTFTITTGKDMNNGDKIEVQYTGKVGTSVSSKQTVNNTATVTAKTERGTDLSDSAAKAVTLYPDATIDIVKAVNKTEFFAGNRASYTLTVTQPTANAVAKSVVITDAMDTNKGATIDASTIQWRYTPSGGSAGGWATTGVSPTSGSVNSYTITTGKDMNNGDKIEVKYNADFASSISTQQTVNNTAKATAKTERGTDISDSDSKTVTVKVPEQPKKTYKSGSAVTSESTKVKIGDVITYEISYQNAEMTAQTVVITDVLDEGLSYVSGSADNGGVVTGTEASGSQTITWTLNNVASGVEGTVSFKAKVNEKAYVGDKTNSEASVENDADVKVGDKPAVTTKTLINKVADPVLSITKSVERSSYMVENTAKYTVVVTNTKSGTIAKNVVIDDEIAEGANIVRTSIAIKKGTTALTGYTLTPTSGTATQSYSIATKADLAYGESFTITYDVTFDKTLDLPATLHNVAHAKADNASQVEDDCDVTVTAPEKSVKSWDPGTTAGNNGAAVKIGDEITYRITWKNYDSKTASIKIVDTLPSGVTFKTGSAFLKANSGSASLGTVTVSGQNVTIPLSNVTEGAEGYVTLTAVVRENAYDGDSIAAPVILKNKATVQVASYTPQETNELENPLDDPVLSITKESDVNIYTIGNTAYYTVVVKNIQPATIAKNVVIHDAITSGTGIKINTSSITIKKGTSAVSGAQIIPNENGTAYSIKTRNDLAYNESFTITYSAQVAVDAAGKTVVNTAEAEADNAEEVDDVNPVEIVEPEKPVKTWAEDTAAGAEGAKVRVGDIITYKISYNNYDSKVNDIKIVDILDEGLNYVADSAVPAAAVSGGKAGSGTQTLTWTIKNVPAHTKGYVTFKAEVNVNALDGTNDDVVNQARVTIGDGSYYKPQDTDIVINLVFKPQLKITKTANSRHFMIGNTGRYTVEVGQTVVGSVAKQVVIEDIFDTADVTISNLKVMLKRSGSAAEDITSVCRIAYSTDSYKINTYQDLFYDDLITVTYDVLFEEGTADSTVTNDVYTKADNAARKTDQWVVTVGTPTPPAKLWKENTKGESGAGVKVGDEISYTISYQNDAGDTQDIKITDLLDPGVELVAPTEGTSGNTSVAIGTDDVTGRTKVVWTLKNVGAGKNGKVELTVRVTEKAVTETIEEDQVENKATVKVGNYSEKETGTLVNRIPNPVLEVEKHSEKPSYYPGNLVKYTVTIKQTEDGAIAKSIALEDIMDSGKGISIDPATIRIRVEEDRLNGYAYYLASDSFTVTPASGSTTEYKIQTSQDLPKGVTMTVTYDAVVADTAKAGTMVNNISTATSTNGAMDEDGNTVEILDVLTPDKNYAEESEAGIGESQVAIGDKITYEISYFNHSTETAQIVVTDHLDPGVSFVSATDGTVGITNLTKPTLGETGTVKWTIASVPARKGGTVKVTVRVNEDAAVAMEVKNKASVKVGNFDETETNELTNELIDPVLNIVKTSDAVTYEAGKTAKYQLVVSQTEKDETAVNVVVTDKLESEFARFVKDSFKVFDKDGQDITKDCKITMISTQEVKIETGKNLLKDEKLKVVYGVEFATNAGGKTIKNTAGASADNSKLVTAEKTVKITKSSNNNGGGGGGGTTIQTGNSVLRVVLYSLIVIFAAALLFLLATENKNKKRIGKN